MRTQKLQNKDNYSQISTLICDVSHSTLKNSERRGGQLSVDTIERICDGLGITMSEFFARKGA
mgnify:CR=1 FL=1